MEAACLFSRSTPVSCMARRASPFLTVEKRSETSYSPDWSARSSARAESFPPLQLK